MLVLSRKLGQKLHVGSEITITVLEVQGNRVRLGVEAPAQFGVLRGELGLALPHARSPGAECGAGDRAEAGG
jgi:carbon storage regulator